MEQFYFTLISMAFIYFNPNFVTSNGDNSNIISAKSLNVSPFGDDMWDDFSVRQLI